MISSEETFRIRPGRARREAAPGRRPQKFVHQVLRASNRSGGLTRTSGGSATGSSFGRGRAAALGMNRQPAARRVVIKTRIVKHGGAGPGALAAHMSYLEREGVTRDGQDAAMFGPESDTMDRTAFAERCADDRHHFRFMVSPEDAEQLVDLRSFTRELMADIERDLDTKLDWQAVDHWNTDNPHVHILVRGIDDTGSDLVISKDYISHGMRGRAEERVSLELGPRSEREINRDLTRQISAERFTKLDAVLQREANSLDGFVDLRTSQADRSATFSSALTGRMQQLEKMRLAFKQGDGRWTLHVDMEQNLRDLGMRGDIIKTMHRAMKQGGHRPDVSRFSIDDASNTRPVEGKLMALRFGDISVTGDAASGAIVESRSWTDSRGRLAKTLAVRSDFDLGKQVTATGATWLDRQLLQDSRQRLGGGFGREVREALERRANHLVSKGLAKRQGRRITFNKNLIATLRARELAATEQQITSETGLKATQSSEGTYLRGIYRKRLQLASGRFAMIENMYDGSKSFELVPWRPALDRHLGKEVGGQIMRGGRVDWNLGRKRGIGR